MPRKKIVKRKLSKARPKSRVRRSIKASSPAKSQPPPPVSLASPDSHPKIKSKILTVGGLLSDTFATYFKNFPTILLLVLLFYVPIFLMKNVCYLAWGPIDSKFWKLIVDSDVLSVFGSLFIPALLFSMNAVRNGERRPSLGDSLIWGFKCWGKNLLYHIAAGVVICAGTLLFVVPGIIFALGYSLITPVVTFERESEISPLNRSQNLVTGHKGTLLGVYAVLCLIAYPLAFIAGIFLGIFLLITGDRPPFDISSHWIAMSVVEGITHLVFILVSVAGFVSYRTLVSRKG